MENAEAIVMQLERDLLEPDVRSDARRLDALIADDFLEVGAAGRAFGKSEVLIRLPDGSETRTDGKCGTTKALLARDKCANQCRPGSYRYARGGREAVSAAARASSGARCR